MITARAVGVFVVAVLLFLLGGATNVGWVRIVDSVLWGMLGLSLVLQWLSVTAVDARRRVVTRDPRSANPSPMEDDFVEVELILHNKWFWPRFFVSVSYDVPCEEEDSGTHRFFVSNLPGHGDVTLTGSLRCNRRGLHRFGPVTVESAPPAENPAKAESAEDAE